MHEFNDDQLDNEIGKLLRLKKYEQPPPGYFEDFLHEFHRRQRNELLQQPIWSVLWQRLTNSLFRLNIPSLTSYPAAATAVLICAAVISLKIYQSPTHGGVAGKGGLPPQPPGEPFTINSPIYLTTRSLGPDLNAQLNERAYTHGVQTPPRYVLDRLPVSYEPSFNF